MQLRHLAHAAPVLLMAWTFSVGQSAQALSITNRDADDMAITVVEAEGKPETKVVVAPNQTLDNICSKGCQITLANGETDSFEGTESVLIEEGQFIIAE